MIPHQDFVCQTVKPDHVAEVGDIVELKIPDLANAQTTWSFPGATLRSERIAGGERITRWETTGMTAGRHDVSVTSSIDDPTTGGPVTYTSTLAVDLRAVPPLQASQTAGCIIPPIEVTMRRTEVNQTNDLGLWLIIRRASENISFDQYNLFMEAVLCRNDPRDSRDVSTLKAQIRTKAAPVLTELAGKRFLPFNDTDSYRILKVATEAFLMVNCGVVLNSTTTLFSDLDRLELRSRTGIDVDLATLNTIWDAYLREVNGGTDRLLPYVAMVRNKLRDVGIANKVLSGFQTTGNEDTDCTGIIQDKLIRPCLLELIWSYWHEEGMLVQTMNAITLRFQNVRGFGPRDPLRMLEMDPLRPLNNLIWGYIQDEQHRLSVLRRVYEYDHHYGLTLYGKAVPKVRTADSRSKFIEAFHNLLYLAAIFYKEDDDTTVVADGFPVLNALKEVHLLLSEGAHNQFGDLPSTARIEMLMQQWLLARPEFREYLPTRIMVAYPEPWMDRVDAMKTLQGWTDTSVLHFSNLANFGERILLSIRFGAWSRENDPARAANWARFWRAEIQGYIHAYRSVTGVDLTAEIVGNQQANLRYAQPWVHLKNRLALQARARA